MKAETAGEIFSKYYAQWAESGVKSADGLVFEATFLQMLRSAGLEVLQGSVGELPSNRNKKNGPNDAG
jgi:hypothetical protein